MSLQRQINRRHKARNPLEHAYQNRMYRAITGQRELPNPDKGKLNGRCNVTACQQPGATWFNTSTRAYYCPACAREITTFARRVDGFDICFASTGDEAQDRLLKFGPQPR